MSNNTKPTLLARRDLHGAANTHLHWGDPNQYHPVEQKAQQIIGFGIDCVRERWNGNKAQRQACTLFAEASVGLYFFIGAMDSKPEDIDRDVQSLVDSGLAPAVVGICGPNEPNKGQGDSWHTKTHKLQQRLYQQVRNHSELDHAPVTAGALKINVPDVVSDAEKFVSTGAVEWCDEGDFHYYPGKQGPIVLKSMAERWQANVFPGKPLWHSETGWTTADTDVDDQSRWVCEALLRSSLLPDLMSATIIYEALDEAPYVEGREGKFGPDWSQTTALLAGIDHGDEFPGWLAAWEDGQPYDGQAVCTSDGWGWTLYLLQRYGSIQHDYTLVLPQGLTCSLGAPTRIGSDGRQRWVDVPVVDSMTTIVVEG